METFLNNDLNISDIQLNSSTISPIKEEIQNVIQKIQDTIESVTHPKDTPIKLNNSTPNTSKYHVNNINSLHKSMFETKLDEDNSQEEPTLKKEVDNLLKIVAKQEKDILDLKKQLKSDERMRALCKEIQFQNVC